MTILNRTINRKRVKKSLISVILSVVMVLLIETCYPGTALAGGIVDVVTEVANKNYQSPEFKSGAEDVTGHGFNMNAGYGGYANGHGGISVLGPVDSGDMSILLSYVDGETQNTNIQTTHMNGGEVREYTMEHGIGVGVVLSDFFITVETYESGNSNSTDFQKAKSIAQQVLDSMGKNGLLSQPAPDIINPSAVKPAKTVPVTSSVVTGKPLDEPIPISDTNNIAGVGNGPTAPTTFTIKTPHLVTFIQNYHWNSAKGASPGMIGLTDKDGKVYGPWQASGKPGQGGVPNAYWEVSPNVVIPAGTYTVTDSAPASWSANTESGGRGMGLVRATPNYKVSSGSVDNLTGKIAGGTTEGINNTESPAGVGSVGTIPGPSNTTEAIVGVAVPGIIAVSLGALAGLGGGGFAPPGGTTQAPNAGGTVPGGGGNYPGSGTPGRGTNPAGAVLDTNQLGRRRREEISIDTDEMGQGSIIMPENDGLYIETSEEAGVFIQTEQILPSPMTDAEDSGILIDTSAFDGPSSARTSIPESGLDIGTESRNGDQTVGRELDGNGFDPEGYNRDSLNDDGFNQAGYDQEGFNHGGFNQAGYNQEGFNKQGFDKTGFDREGFNQSGFDKEGFNREGFNQAGYDQEGFNQQGFDKTGYDREGFNQSGFDQKGYNREGFNQAGYDQEGFNKQGFDKIGYDHEGYNQSGFDQKGYNREGFNQAGYDQEGFNKQGFDQAGYDREGFSRTGFDKEGYDREGFNQKGFDEEGFDRAGFDKTGFDKAGFNQEGFDKIGFDKEGFNKGGFDVEGFDKSGFNKAGFDSEGYGRNGFNSEGFDREGFDVNGYNAKGYNRSGYNPKGYNAAGYDKNGFNEDGWDKEGFGKDGLDKAGFDREGYDKASYDKNGYNREGYDREGRQLEGYDEQGYDKNGFNKDGFDRDGCDREGFNYEGYNRAGYDPWGYDKNGYGKDGYHWSGYNADGYDRNGRHWDKNPFEGDGNPFNVASQNPFEDDREVLPYGVTWKATKPPLGEPYPKTLDKYGAKPWTNDPQVPEPSEATSIPKPDTKDGDGFVPGPEDPQGTLKNHDVGTENAPQTPNESNTPDNQPENSQDNPSNQPVEPGDANTFTYTDPETGKTTTYEYEPGYTGPRQGETQILVGKTDGQTYNLKFDAVKGKWVNTESGNEFNPEAFEGWQNNLAIDKQRAAEELAKMAKRLDANSKAIDENLADWKKIDQIQKTADKYNIGEPGGPGDVDNTIQKLKDDMLAGKQLDQSKVDKIRRVIDNRIMGKTTADNGESWEEVPWYQDVDSALKANAATVKEVVTAEKDDGSFSWLGMGARIMITGLSGGITYVGQVGSIAVEVGSGVVMDGALTVAEAMYRMKDSIDKGESENTAVSRAIGMTILGEEMGWLAGKAGGQLMKETMEKFPVFTNKAADFIEVGLLKIMKADQIASKGLGMISKESAEETLKKIQKRITEIGADSAEQSIDKATSRISSVVADSSDDISGGAGKAVSSSGDDIAKGGSKAASESGDDITRSVKPGDASKTPDAPDSVPDNIPEDINRGARTPQQVLDDPAAIAKAEKTMQKNVKDYDKLPPNKQQELVRDQAIYDEYKLQAQEKTWNIADKVQNQKDITVEDILEMKADPASMRTLKNMEQVDGLGAELGTGGSRQVQTKFNDVLNENVYQPSYRDVESHLSGRYNGAEIRVQTVRTPKAGQECNPWDINTDNDIVAQRLVNGPNGPEWVEIPRGEWEDVYYKSYAQNTGFNVDDATRRFPSEEWSGMTEPQQVKKWAELHGEEPADVGMLAGGRDFSNQRSAMLNGECPMREATPAELERGIESVTIDGKQMVPTSTSELVQRGQTTLLDSEQLSMMEKYKINNEWNKPGSPAEIMKNQTESMEQLSKAAAATQGIESSYRNMGFKVEQMPDNMQQAIKVVENNSLSPAMRAARLQELGYPTPGDFVEKVTSRMGAIRAARR